MRLLIAIILLLLAFAAAFMFANQNDQLIELNYLFGKTAIDLVFLITLCLALGLLIGLLMSGTSLVKTRVQLKNTRRKLLKAEQEIQKQKAGNQVALPAKDDL